MGPGRLVLKGGETLGSAGVEKKKKKKPKEFAQQEEGEPGQVAGRK
jgi:hypothetical protein